MELEKEEFRRFLRGNKKLATSTTKVLIGCLPKDCFEWTEIKGKEFYFFQIDREDTTSTYKNNLHYAVKYFFGWKGWEFTYRKPKVDKARRKPVELEDIWKLFDVIDSKRDLALIMLHLYTGARPSEILNAKREDLDLDKGELQIKNTKAYIDRCVPVNKKALMHVRRYLSGRRDNDPHLFYSRESAKLTGSGYRHLLEKYCKKAGIKRITPYQMRHTFGTEWVAQGNGNLYVLKNILGHSNIATTENYIKFNMKMVKNSYEKSCPEF
ncbi:MAG: putative tyrosine recombinase XerC-like protein [Euryarchaeota archaeon ADurb.Bin023]|jgi:integrase|nr:MAG: putative tyrosine recombinase XerC-like protein [Euryarchaeota archaeon ADurb.Bin023]HOD62216.1 site-specific integrase [Bacilli bacterium]HPU91583.1 site-specific integrase [Methanofastidiosum sp.]